MNALLPTELMTEIANTLGISVVDPTDITAFWRDVAFALSGSYSTEPSTEIARELISGHFDREWDPDEFLTEDGEAPSLRAYEEILDISIRFVAQPLDG